MEVDGELTGTHVRTQEEVEAFACWDDAQSKLPRSYSRKPLVEALILLDLSQDEKKTLLDGKRDSRHTYAPGTRSNYSSALQETIAMQRPAEAKPPRNSDWKPRWRRVHCLISVELATQN